MQIIISKDRIYEFYKRNDFNNTGYYIDDTDEFLVLSTKEELNVKEYKKLLKIFLLDITMLNYKK